MGSIPIIRSKPAPFAELFSLKKYKNAPPAFQFQDTRFLFYMLTFLFLKYIFHYDGFFTARPHGNDADGDADFFRNIRQVFFAERWKPVIVTDGADFFFPSFVGFINRSNFGEEFQICRIFFNRFSFIFIADTDFDFFQLV